MIQAGVDVELDSLSMWHFHPGEEIIYVLEGSLEYPGRWPAGERGQGR
jgi:quercetin dioxygenase-like cupin family protein